MATKITLPVSQDPAIVNLLGTMPKDVRESFTELQLAHLRNAVGARKWGSHRIDFRTTFGFFSYRYYLVLLAGKNIRTISRQQQKLQLFMNAMLLTFFIVFCTLLGLLVLYLLKSALGINLFENFSLGIWAWFKG
jgi:hypothetical protein